jgi:enamine deaminase RidA (YjgF/YER057c/UK114 family)
MRNGFEKIGAVLREADLTFRSLVEMTSYHVGLRGHFDLFNAIRLEYAEEPYPAWTAIGVSELIVPGGLVELRAVAELPSERGRSG